MDTSKFKGIIAPIVSPCDEADELDEAALEAQFARLLASGVNGLYINGGTGDGSRLTTGERKHVAELLVPRLKAAGKCSIVHVGQTHLRAAVELAEHAAAIGADAVASIPPDGSWDEIVSWYEALAKAGLPVFVYYIPGVTKKTAGLAELRRILDVPGVLGIKMSDWNLFLLRQVKLAYPEKVVYSGYDEMLSLGLFYGADGSIGTWANLLPDMYAKVYALVQAGRYNDVIPVQEAFTEFLAICWDYGVIDAFEELMRAKGWASRCLRRPTTWDPGKLPADVVADLLARIDSINALADSI